MSLQKIKINSDYCYYASSSPFPHLAPPSLIISSLLRSSLDHQLVYSRHNLLDVLLWYGTFSSFARDIDLEFYWVSQFCVLFDANYQWEEWEKVEGKEKCNDKGGYFKITQKIIELKALGNRRSQHRNKMKLLFFV